jgi:ring-1,2-phenylacetyl-CoA epoxidase subunit PaaE
MKDISQYSGNIAIPTIILSLFLFTAHIAVSIYCLIGVIPIIVGMLTNTILCSYMYTVHHESTHGNISGRKPKFKWLDELFGKTAAAFMDLSFTGYSRAHIAHHKYANSSRDTVVDAHFNSIWGNVDRYLKAMLIKYVNIIPNKTIVNYLCGKLMNQKMRVQAKIMLKTYPEISRSNRIATSIVLASFFTEYGSFVLWLWYVPTLLYPIINMIIHDWLPHNVYDKEGRRSTGKYLDTQIFTWPGSHIITCAQDYHLIHHMHSDIPFYNYKKTYLQIQNELRSNGAKIKHKTIKKVV